MADPSSIHSYINEGIVAIALSLAGWVVLFPIRALFSVITKEWGVKSSILLDIQEELKEQRTNCLTNLQHQGNAQIDLLTQTVKTLGDMHLDQRTLLGKLDAYFVTKT